MKVLLYKHWPNYNPLHSPPRNRQEGDLFKASRPGNCICNMWRNGMLPSLHRDWDELEVCRFSEMPSKGKRDPQPSRALHLKADAEFG